MVRGQGVDNHGRFTLDQGPSCGASSAQELEVNAAIGLVGGEGVPWTPGSALGPHVHTVQSMVPVQDVLDDVRIREGVEIACQNDLRRATRSGGAVAPWGTREELSLHKLHHELLDLVESESADPEVGGQDPQVLCGAWCGAMRAVREVQGDHGGETPLAVVLWLGIPALPGGLAGRVVAEHCVVLHLHARHDPDAVLPALEVTHLAEPVEGHAGDGGQDGELVVGPVAARAVVHLLQHRHMEGVPPSRGGRSDHLRLSREIVAVVHVGSALDVVGEHVEHRGASSHMRGEGECSVNYNGHTCDTENMERGLEGGHAEICLCVVLCCVVFSLKFQGDVVQRKRNIVERNR